jgi:hypothetical protein
LPKKPAVQKRAEISEIKRLMILGKTHQEIMNKIHMPHATFYRYLNEIWKRDEKQMLQQQNDGIAAAINFTKDRLKMTLQNLDAIANDPKVKPKDRIEAGRVTFDIAISLLKLEAEQYTLATHKDILSINRSIEQNSLLSRKVNRFSTVVDDAMAEILSNIDSQSPIKGCFSTERSSESANTAAVF